MKKKPLEFAVITFGLFCAFVAFVIWAAVQVPR